MIDLDRDPRVTAYVLGELDHDEREIFEQDLANADGGAAVLIEEIEEIVQMLDEIFASEPEYRMTEAQRVAVLGGTGVVPDPGLEPADEAEGKVLPWVVRPTIGKREKAVIAERLRPSATRMAARALVVLGIAASLVTGLFWMVKTTVLDRDMEAAAAGGIELVDETPPAPMVPTHADPPRGTSLDLAKDLSGQPTTVLASVDPNASPPANPLVYNGVSGGTIDVSGVSRDAFVTGGATAFGERGPSRGGVGFGTGIGGGGAATGGKATHPQVIAGALIRSRGVTAQEEGRPGEGYTRVPENQFKEVLEGQNQLSTFSIDVDTASYSNVRRMLLAGSMPPAGSVRIEEMLNYFDYSYAQPQQPHPFSASLEVAGSPWNRDYRLVRIALKGREVEPEARPASNLVFLIDVSGSMQSHDKLPLLKTSMAGLVRNLREQDKVSIVVYASESGQALEPTSGADPEQILSAIRGLNAAGSTNGGAGIELAYRIAKENFIEGGVNRVLLATDGDFNVGTTDHAELVKMVAARARDHIFLTVLGFGSGNLKDDLIEKISNEGNGNSFYIGDPQEGHKVLVEEMGGTLHTIAKDVKIQVEFNPAKVASYRLIGYENRLLRNRDFNDDKKDAGEVGAGHTVTALYEIVPVGVAPAVDELKYGADKAARRNNDSPELLTLKLRYKQPEGEESTRFDVPVIDAGKRWEESSEDFRFAAAVAGFGMLLTDSEFKGDLNYEFVKELAEEGVGEDPKGYRKEFVELIDRAQKLSSAAP